MSLIRSAGSRGRNSLSIDGTCRQREADQLKGERSEGTRALALASEFQRRTNRERERESSCVLKGPVSVDGEFIDL